MKFTAKQYAEALMDSLQDTSPKDQNLVIDNFAAVLAANNDLRMFDQIAEEFHKLDLAKQGIKQAHVKSATPLSRENEKEIIEHLNKIAKTKIELKKDVDDQLIGGMVIQIDDQLIDTSIKHQLEQLKDNLGQ